MKLTKTEQEVMLQALIADKAITSKKLEDLELLIKKIQDIVINDNTVIIDKDKQVRRRNSDTRNTYFEKIKEILLEVEEATDNFKGYTSREILTKMYEYFPDEMDEEDDRKNIATVSAVLYSKVEENELEALKEGREQSRFRLVPAVDKSLEEFDAFLTKKISKVVPDDDDVELPF